MTPLTATLAFIIISIIITFLKHFFSSQTFTDQYSFLKLNLLYTIPSQFQPQKPNFFNSLYQSYTQTPMNTKKVTIQHGQYQKEHLHVAAQNDLVLVNCGEHYTIILETGIKKGIWISRLGLYTLPYMKELQVMTVPGKLQMNLKMQCKSFFTDLEGHEKSTSYTMTYSLYQAQGWSIYTLKIITPFYEPLYPRNFFPEKILTAIPSKPLAIAVSQSRNIYVYTTEDTPWILDIQSMEYQIPYKRFSSRIDLFNNGPRIYSSYGTYRATTYNKYLQQWNNYQDRSPNKTDFQFVSKYKRTGIIIPYQIIVSKSGNRVTFIYQHKNHPYCVYNILMSSTWDISAMNHHTRYDNLIQTKNLDLYLRSGPHYHYGHNSDSYFNYLFSGVKKTQHTNTAADIIGTVYQQTSEYIVDCQLIQSKKSIFTQSQSVFCSYLVKGSHYLNIVRLGNQITPQTPIFQALAENQNNQSDKNARKKQDEFQDIGQNDENGYFEYLSFKNKESFQDIDQALNIKDFYGNNKNNQQIEQSLLQSKALKNNTKSQTKNDSQQQNILFSQNDYPKVIFHEQHVTNMPQRNRTDSLQHIYFPLPKQTNALTFKNLKILSLNGTQNNNNPIILLQTDHYSDQSYIFTCQFNGTKTNPYKFFDLKSRFLNMLRSLRQKDIQKSLLRKIDFRVLQASYIDQKIIFMWGWGIQIYQLQDERIQRQKFEGVPMDYFLPFVQLFAMVFCMFQVLISTS